jgi:hypothetical protein
MTWPYVYEDLPLELFIQACSQYAPALPFTHFQVLVEDVVDDLLSIIWSDILKTTVIENNMCRRTPRDNALLSGPVQM